MIELFELYTKPLIKVEEPEFGRNYCTVDGNIVKLVKLDDDCWEYDIIQLSELKEGELITDLDVKLLTLFWRLMRYNSKNNVRCEDDSNKD